MGPDVKHLAKIQARTLSVLFVLTIFARAALAVVFAVAGLLVGETLGSTTWTGSAIASATVGTAFGSSLLSSYMQGKGRRPGLALGFAVAAVGCGCSAVGAQVSSIVFVLGGTFLVGVGLAAASLARYAAADLATQKKKARAISLVVFASTGGSVGGPVLVRWSEPWGADVGLANFGGTFIVGAIFFAAAALVGFVALRPDPLLVARNSGAASGDTSATVREGFRVVSSSPKAVLAVVGLVVSTAVMVMVMAMTPLHMDAHGHDVEAVGWVISVHAGGMFAFAPVAGWFSDRFGYERAIRFGGVLLVLAAVFTALAGEAPLALMYPGLFLLGLGWSFGLVASSALLNDSVADSERVQAQGSADVFSSLASGASALLSGLVFTMAGFHVLSALGILAAGMLVVLTVWFSGGGQKKDRLDDEVSPAVVRH